MTERYGPGWAELREKALERDGHRCTDCGRKDHLEVHHREYGDNRTLDLNNVTTLCKWCHAHADKQRREREHEEGQGRIPNNSTPPQKSAPAGRTTLPTYDPYARVTYETEGYSWLWKTLFLVAAIALAALVLSQILY